MFKKQLEDDKKRMEARIAMVNTMMDIMLESEAPEHIKLDIKIMKAASNLKATIDSCLLERYIMKESTPEDNELKKNLLEYILMVEVGVKQFAEANPVKDN